MTAIAREVISQIRGLADTAEVCIVFTGYEGLPCCGGHHFCPQLATLKIHRQGSHIERVEIEQGAIRATASFIGQSIKEGMVSLLVNRRGGHQAIMAIDLNPDSRSEQVATFSRERKMAEINRSWHPMWYLHHLLS